MNVHLYYAEFEKSYKPYYFIRQHVLANVHSCKSSTYEVVKQALNFILAQLEKALAEIYLRWDLVFNRGLEIYSRWINYQNV